MKNIWRIFTRDVCHATRNVIAIIVAMGLIIVPALYAWYNIAASWDPYGNTKSLKVAVANVDSGYKSDLIPVRVNIGETVVSSLRANHDLDWQFVDRDTAIDGVHSGEYYAALIIPKQFSADMMTLFSPEMKHAELEYYLNEKINPIAPHITDQGASTVATTIDQTFAKTLAQVALDLVSSLLKFAQSPQMSEYVSNATKHISSISSQLKSAASQADSYASLMGATGKIISSTDRLLGSTGSSASDAKKALKQGTAGVKSLDEALAGVSTSMSSSLSDAAGARSASRWTPRSPTWAPNPPRLPTSSPRCSATSNRRPTHSAHTRRRCARWPTPRTCRRSRTRSTTRLSRRRTRRTVCRRSPTASATPPRKSPTAPPVRTTRANP